MLYLDVGRLQESTGKSVLKVLEKSWKFVGNLHWASVQALGLVEKPVLTSFHHGLLSYMHCVLLSCPGHVADRCLELITRQSACSIARQQ